MRPCPNCGHQCEDEARYCSRCGTSLESDSPPLTRAIRPSRIRRTATATPIGPAPAALTEEFGQPRTLLQLLRPIAEGVVISFLTGLLYLLISFYLSKTYTPLSQFYKDLRGFIWLAIISVGCAWASKDERENGFLFGTAAGALAGLFLTLAEDAFLGWASASLKHTLGVLLLTMPLGFIAGTVSAMVGSPVMVRFPTRQKRLALLLIVIFVALSTLIVAIPSESEEYYQAVGRAYFYHKMYAPAAEAFNAALRLNPWNANNHNDVAVCYQFLNQPTEALDHWRRATVIDPDLPEPHKNLGHVYLEEGLHYNDPKRLEDAIQQYLQFINLIPQEDPYVYYTLAFAYSLLNQNEEALRWARRSLELDPNNQEAQALLRALESTPPTSESASTP
ncbi:MAG TPA: tetratricopeptide repeat protein [Armatimonadetes bacterium]|nr:tetratricopeptide repeat protein [Armatimonadota bacterium]